MANVLYTSKNLDRQPTDLRKTKLTNKFLRLPYFLWSASDGNIDRIYLQNNTGNGSTVKITPNGVGRTFGDGSFIGYYWGGRTNLAIPRWTIATHFTAASASTYQVLLSTTLGNNGLMVRLDSTGTSLEMVKPGIELVNSLALTVGESYFAIMSHDEGSDNYYILLKNIRTETITSVSGTTTSASAGGDGVIVLGNITYSGVGRSLNGTINSAYLGLDYTPLNIAYDWLNNSWAHFNTDLETLAIIIGSTNYDLVVDPSSYSLTASNISLLNDRLLTLSPNTYTLTTSNISLLNDRLLTLSPNTYTLTTSNTDLLNDRLLTLSPNTYTLTTSNTNLLNDRLLTLSPNTYTLTNFNINLLNDRLLTLSPNTYTLTNFNINYVINRALSIDSSTYTLTTSNTSLLNDRLLTLSPNTYTLTNFNISYTIDRGLSIDPNTYILTTLNTSLLADRLLTVSPNTYILTAFDISYDLGKIFSIDPAVYVLTNSDVNFNTQRLLNIISNNIILTNYDISLLANKLLSIDSYSYNISTSNLYYYLNRSIDISPFSVDITNNSINYLYNRILNINSISYTFSFNDVYFSTEAVQNTGDILGSYITDKYISRIVLDKLNIRFISE